MQSPAEGEIAGIAQILIAVVVALVVGPLLVSALQAGSGYPLAFGALAAITGAGTLAFVVLREPRPRVPAREACGCGDAGLGATR